MKRLMDALALFIAEDPEMQKFMGRGGPFKYMPEPTRDLPYIMLTQIGGMPNIQGFTRNYIARAHIRIMLWDRDAEAVMTNGEYVTTKLDVLGSLSLGGGELCRLPIRIEEPRFVPMLPDRDGVSIFGCALEYRFNVQRTRGV